MVAAQDSFKPMVRLTSHRERIMPSIDLLVEGISRGRCVWHTNCRVKGELECEANVCAVQRAVKSRKNMMFGNNKGKNTLF
jgi:hypothetical protein